MTLVSPPGGGLVYRINPHDGSLSQGPFDLGWGPSLGPGTVVLTGVPSDSVSQSSALPTLTAALASGAVGFPLPFGRYTLTWNALIHASAAAPAVTNVF